MKEETLIKEALKEDIGKGDITSKAIFPKAKKAKAMIKAKSFGVLCGIDLAEKVFKMQDKKLKFKKIHKDGAIINKRDIIATIEGNVQSILAAERTALNFLQHLSGIATTAYRYNQIISKYGVKLLDTRKTIPGYRALEKYAVVCGGGQNHRIGLYDMFLIKDNHIKAAGSIKEAVQKVRKAKIKKRIEIEVSTFAELEEAIAAHPDLILLDNMSYNEVEEAVRIRGFSGKKIPLEVSGGIALDNIEHYAQLGIEYISVGSALTLGAKPVDFSLDIL